MLAKYKCVSVCLRVRVCVRVCVCVSVRVWLVHINPARHLTPN